MSQNSLVLPTTGTVSGLETVQKVNQALDTLGSLSSGPAEPSSPQSGQFWLDTGVGGAYVLKIRNSANDGWTLIGKIDSLLFGALPISGGSMAGPLKLAKGANIASVATIDLSAATGNTAHITGTTTTTAVTMSPGQWMECIADAAWPLTYHATNLKLNTGGTDYTCSAGDRIFFFFDGTTVYANIVRNDGKPLSLPSASTSVIGAIRVATDTEIKAGSSSTLAMTPLQFLAAAGFSGYFESTAQSITAGGTLTIAHGLGRKPVLFLLALKCTSAENGYSVNDQIHHAIGPQDLGGANGNGVEIIADTNNLYIRFGNAAATFRALNFSTGAAVGLTNANWSAYFRCWG